ncbi:MAG: ATP-dependent zinc metalloprotease FtsH [Planctomycetes bacterium]|nr:ATP-dependent zinc metalloprotease FtsH [Planctomycetota bacterium]
MNREPATQTLKYGELVEILSAAKDNPALLVSDVHVNEHDIKGKITFNDPVSDGDKNAPRKNTINFRTQRLGLENDQGLHAQLKSVVGASYQGAEEESAFKGVTNFLFIIIFFVALGVALLLMVRWMSGGGGPLTFGRSRAKLYAQQDVGITFDDVAGIDEAVAELREVVDFLKRPEKYQALGGRIPKGVLLVGPPGTGKTLLAKAVAGEAEVPFFSLSGSDFVEMFVGVGAARVRDLFGQADARAPAIIFIDELDALGKSRAGNLPGSHDEREQTLNQLLVEMDGFDSNRGVIIMGATNRPETLDVALLRPGRFDRTVVVDRPDVNGREAILKVHVRHVRMGPDVNLRHVANLTPGSVGADLANLVNEAALMAARAGRECVTMAEFNEAIERAAVGLERKSRIMLPEEKQRVAFHEAGHALVACSLPNTDPVHKISIIPRGVGVGGYVLSRPDEDRHLMTRTQLESQIRICLGGTLAEEIIFDNEISTGATSDLEKANNIARRMVTEFGMSRLGRIYFHDNGGPGFLGNGLRDTGDYSEQTAREIDVESRSIIERATDEVRELLVKRRAALEAVARRLIEKETMDGAELRDLLLAHGTVPHNVHTGVLEGWSPGDGGTELGAVPEHRRDNRNGAPETDS